MDKLKVFLSIPMREQKAFINSKIFRDTWEDFFRSVISILMDVDERDIEFVRSIIGEPGSDYKQTELFKTSREMCDQMSGCDVCVFPADFENHTNCVVEAFTAISYGMSTIAITDVNCEEGDITDIYMNTANIHINDEPYDGPSELGMFTDKFDNYTRLFCEESLDVMEIVQLSERGDN